MKEKQKLFDVSQGEELACANASTDVLDCLTRQANAVGILA